MDDDLRKQEMLARFRETLHNLAIHCFAGESVKAKQLGLTVTQTNLIRYVNEYEAVRMSDIAKRLNVTLGRITRVSQELLKLGLVILERDLQDRRSVLLMLTETGRNMKKRLIEIDLMFCEQALNDKDVSDIEAFLICLEKLNQAIVTVKPTENS